MTYDMVALQKNTIKVKKERQTDSNSWTDPIYTR